MDRLYPWRHSARRLTRRRVFGLTAATALATSLAACGRSRGGSAPRASGGPASPTSGGQLRFSYPIDPNTFEPATMQVQTGMVLNFTNDPLVKLKAGPDVKYGDLIVAPELASRWEIPDAQTYVFHLNPGARFADLPPVNGRPVTAADVKWSFEYLSRTGELKQLPPAPSTALFPGLQSVTTPDQATVSIQLGQPYTSFLYNATQNEACVLAHEIFDADGDFSKRAAGTGPWQIDTSASEKGARWVFKKNPRYFVQGRPYIDEVNWLVLPDAVTRRAAFESGQLDILEAADMSPDLLPELKRAVPNVDVYEIQGADGAFLYMNESKPPLNDVRIRKAISLAIDRDEFIAVFAKGKGDWALCASLPGLFTPQEVREVLQYDPAKAKQLVKDAGHPDGLTMEIIYPGAKFGTNYVTALELLQSQLGKIGITVKLTSLDAPTASDRLHSGDYSLYVTPGPATGISSDPGAKLNGLFDPASGVNYGRVNDAKLTSLLKAVQAEIDPGKRKEDVRTAVRYANEVPHALEVYTATTYTLWHPYVKNYALQVDEPRYYVETWTEK